MEGGVPGSRHFSPALESWCNLLREAGGLPGFITLIHVVKQARSLLAGKTLSMHGLASACARVTNWVPLPTCGVVHPSIWYIFMEMSDRVKAYKHAEMYADLCSILQVENKSSLLLRGSTVIRSCGQGYSCSSPPWPFCQSGFR